MLVAHSQFPAGHSGGDSRNEASSPGLDAGGAREHSTTGARFSFQTLCLRIAWALSPRLKAIIRQQRLVEPKTKPQVETRGFAGVANEHKIRVIIEMQFGNNWSILHI
jgi:hypothetical protein